MTDQGMTNSYRTTARIVGIVFLAGMVVYITGNVLVQSILEVPDHLSIVPENSRLLAVGAFLMLLAAVGDAAHGILMYPVMKLHSERIAVGYFGARMVDAVMIAVGVALVLVQIPIAREYIVAEASQTPSLQSLSTLAAQAHLYAYELGMFSVGFAGLMLTTVFYRLRLVPRFIAVWGLVGYASLWVGSALQIVGFDLQFVHTIPGGLWELFIGVWLLVKGFNISPATSA